MEGSFPFLPPSGLSPPVEAVAAATSVFTEYVFRESVDSAHNSQISSTFQEADCLLKLVKINKQVFAITLLSRNLNHTAQLSISARGETIILSVGLGGRNGKDPNGANGFCRGSVSDIDHLIPINLR